MGVCGSKDAPGTANGPVGGYDIVDGPVVSREKKTPVPIERKRDPSRKTDVSENGLKPGNDIIDSDIQDNGRINDEVKSDQEPKSGKEANGVRTQPVEYSQNSVVTDKGSKSGIDEKDIGSQPVRLFRTDQFANLEIIDLDEDTDYQQLLQQAYRRQPQRLTREDLLADVYKMDFPRRGKAVVINNEKFQGSTQRKGTYVDFTKICNRLERLGFQVERRSDATCSQIMEAFATAANEDHSDADCFAAVFLSHGAENEIHGTDGVLKLNAIFELFQASRCKTLAGKPKLFFVQACRGEMFDDGTDVNVADAVGMRGLPEEEVELEVPDEADFLISYSTVNGYYAWRNSQKGSWYIQALVRVLDECGTLLELRKILTRVNKIVAYEYQSKDRTHFQKKQIPSFASKLTKDLYFDPK